MKSLWLMELRLASRRGENLLVAFGFPIGTTLLLAAGIFGTSNPTEAVARGIAVAVAGGAFVSVGINTAFERQQGVLQRLGATPLGPTRLVAAKAAGAFTLLLLQIAAVLATGAALGWDPFLGFEIIPALILGSLAFAGLGLFLAAVLRAEPNLAVTNGLFVLLLLLGGLAVDVERLPDAVARVASFGPAVPLVDGLRSGLGASATPNLAILAGWAAVLCALAVAKMRWNPSR